MAGQKAIRLTLMNLLYRCLSTASIYSALIAAAQVDEGLESTKPFRDTRKSFLRIMKLVQRHKLKKVKPMPNLPVLLPLILALMRHWRCYKHFTIYMGNLAYLQFVPASEAFGSSTKTDTTHSTATWIKSSPPFDSPSLCSLSYILGFVRKTCQHLKGKSALPSRLSSPEIFQGSFQWEEWKKWIQMDTNGRNASIFKYQSLPIPMLEIVKTSACFLGSLKFEPSKSEVQDLIREWSCWERLWVSPALVRRGGAEDVLRFWCHKNVARFRMTSVAEIRFCWISLASTQHLMTFCENFTALFSTSTITAGISWLYGFYGLSIRMQRSNRREMSTTPYLLNLHGKALNLQCQLHRLIRLNFGGRGHCTFQTFSWLPGLAPTTASC